MARESEAGANHQNALQLFRIGHRNFGIPKLDQMLPNGEISK